MPVLYGPFQSVLKDKNGEQLFYPRVLRTGNVSTSQISKEIAAYSSLSPGDVKNTLDNLVTVVSQHLQSSESVTLDGFGTFRLVMKSNGKGVKTVDDVSAAQASLTVRFLPCSTRHLDGTMATRSLVTGAGVSVSTVPIPLLLVKEGWQARRRRFRRWGDTGSVSVILRHNTDSND